MPARPGRKPGSKKTASSSRPAPSLHIESIDDVRAPFFKPAYALYLSSFPEPERVPKRYFQEYLAEKRLGLLEPFNYHFFVARRGRRVLGFVCGYYLAVVNMGFIDYLAVSPSQKGARIGSQVRRRLVRAFQRDARAAGYRDLRAVVGEVEPNNSWLRHLVKRRSAFALDVEYLQPPLGTSKAAVPLVLYLQPIEKELKRIAVAEAKSLLFAIYRRVYRIQYPLREPNFRSLLKQLKGRKTVGARAV